MTTAELVALLVSIGEQVPGAIQKIRDLLNSVPAGTVPTKEQWEAALAPASETYEQYTGETPPASS